MYKARGFGSRLCDKAELVDCPMPFGEGPFGGRHFLPLAFANVYVCKPLRCGYALGWTTQEYIE